MEDHSHKEVMCDINDIILEVTRTRFKIHIGRNDWPHVVTELHRNINIYIISVMR